MPRPKWEPATVEQEQAIAALESAAAAAQVADEKMWEKARAARALGVPANFIAAKTGTHRRTVHRHIPPADGERHVE